MADRVMRMAEPSSVGSAAPAIRRRGTARPRGDVRMYTGRVEASASADAEMETGPAVLAAGRGSAPLPAAVRSQFEPRFGQDFRHVRVHADSESAAAARSAQARAYTRGTDIVFGAEQFSPGTADGQRLLAHELAHVVQHGPMGIGGPRADPAAVDVPSQTSHNPNVITGLSRRCWG